MCVACVCVCCRWQVRSHGSNSLFILLFHHHHHGDNRTGMVLSTSRGLLSKGHTTVFSPPTRYVNRWLESTSLTRRPLSSPVADLEPKSWIADLENDLRDKKSKKKRVRVDAASRVHDSLAVQWHSKVGNRMRHAHTHTRTHPKKRLALFVTTSLTLLAFVLHHDKKDSQVQHQGSSHSKSHSSFGRFSAFGSFHQ